MISLAFLKVPILDYLSASSRGYHILVPSSVTPARMFPPVSQGPKRSDHPALEKLQRPLDILVVNPHGRHVLLQHRCTSCTDETLGLHAAHNRVNRRRAGRRPNPQAAQLRLSISRAHLNHRRLNCENSEEQTAKPNSHETGSGRKRAHRSRLQCHFELCGHLLFWVIVCPSHIPCMPPQHL